MTAIETMVAQGSFLQSLPLNDWQFWVTTAVVIGAIVWIFRSTILPIFTARRQRSKRVTLTMDGEPIKK